MEPSESSTRELTLEEAVSFAILLQKNEQLADAHEVLRRVLETAPDHPRALHYAGVLAHQQGRNGEALALIELKQPQVAQARLQYLVDNFPQAEETPLARERLAVLKDR